MKYTIKSLTVKNFVVFVDEVTINFSNEEINQIEAIFKQDPGQSNGAGKSVLLCAISLALFGKGIRFSHLSDYIAPTNPNGGIYISLVLVDETGNELKIERWRKPGTETNKARVWMNSVQVSKDATTTKADELISGYIGVTHSNFISCIFSVMLPGFLNLRPAQRFEILENALAVKKLDSIIKKLNAALRKAEESLVELDRSLTDKYHFFGQETAKKEVFTQNKTALLTSIKRQEDELKILYAEEQRLSNSKQGYVDVTTEISIKIKDKQAQLNQTEVKLAAIMETKSQLLAQFHSVKTNFKQLGDSEIECLLCHSTLDKTSEQAIKKHYLNELSALDDRIDKYKEGINLVKDVIKSLEASLSKANRAITTIDNNIKINSSSTIACEKMISTSKESLQIAESSFNEERLVLLEQELTKLKIQKSELIKEIKIVTAWKQAMSKNGLRLAYIREEVDTLSAIATKFASSVYNKPTSVKFFINEDRDTPQLDFTVNGTGVGAFSTGERRLLEIAITLSLMSLLKTSGMALEVLVLDEAMDGLSQSSKANVFDVIYRLSEDYQIIMISHDEMLKNKPGNIIRVIKDASTGTSTLDFYTRK